MSYNYELFEKVFDNTVVCFCWSSQGMKYSFMVWFLVNWGK